MGQLLSFGRRQGGSLRGMAGRADGGGGRPLPDLSAFACDPSTQGGGKGEGAEPRPDRREGASATTASAGRKRKSASTPLASPSSATKKGNAGSASSPKKRRAGVGTTPSKKKKGKAAKTTPSKSSGASASSSAKKRKAVSPRSPRTPKVEPGSLDPPPEWESIWSLVAELREDRSAPVDTDGGSELPQRNRGEVVWRFQVLVALMLSSQTKDAVVGMTMRALQERGLDVDAMHAMPAEDLNALIGKVGFHNNKTKYLKQTCEILIEKYGGDIPPNAKAMMELPGVGPKMAYIVESVCFGTNSGIGVDTHMHRMFNDLGWVTSKTPEKTREQLEGWLPRERWGEANVLWVGIGQETQQQKEKALTKALACSRPADALKLFRRLRVDLKKEGKRFMLEEAIEKALKEERAK